MAYADVAVNSAVPYRNAFTYSVPAGMALTSGQAVYVPFGRQTLQGIVLRLTEVPAYPETRDVIAPISDRPVLSPHHVALAEWLAARYLSPIFAAVALMLPPGFERRPLTFVALSESAANADIASLSPEMQLVVRLLAQHGSIEVEVLAREAKLPRIRTLIEQLVRRGIVERSYELSRPRVGPKVVLQAQLLVSAAEAMDLAAELTIGRRPSRRADVLRLLAEEGPSLPAAELRTRTGAGLVHLRDLERRGVVALKQVIVERDPLADKAYAPRPAPMLTLEQERALAAIAQAISYGRTETFLLHGVTGSGKTEVYLQALARTVERGRKGIVLVPEIALTPQTVQRFAERFPGRVAVLHSGLSLGELHDQWYRIRDGHYDVVIGARSALFAPQPDLGLIVIDEEHEWTYKQEDPAPRYHARDAARELARLTNAALILGSATPDVETYHLAYSGHYQLLELPYRIATQSEQPQPLPAVEVVDMREELKAGNRSIFSHPLQAAINAALSTGEQVILFLNRRGSSAFVQCRDCGQVQRCSGCDVALTYHADIDRLVCHQCGRRRRLVVTCPQCGSLRFRHMGIGTQRVEEEAAAAFPGARLLRWDRDVTRGRYSHERILARFLNGEADILIGTQMVAKGLDMPRVTLVGVLAADIGLHLPDYRSAERTFQLLTQVAGRAGRGRAGGRVIIQTYSPHHYAVVAASQHDYETFYRDEIEWRRRSGYPPFSRLACLTFAHTGQIYAQRQAMRVARDLEQKRDALGIPNLHILGPAPAFVRRVRGRYRWQIILRGDDPAALLSQMTFGNGWTVDIDPVSLL